MGGLDVVISKVCIGSCAGLALFGLLVFGSAGFALLVLEFVKR